MPHNMLFALAKVCGMNQRLSMVMEITDKDTPTPIKKREIITCVCVWEKAKQRVEKPAIKVKIIKIFRGPKASAKIPAAAA